uniref:Uncharacterized protein n=1 Tax=Anguilla anguilla TaxID=7936 RepID=A0A0E9QKL0_ANGAN
MTEGNYPNAIACPLYYPGRTEGLLPPCGARAPPPVVAIQGIQLGHTH